jgi:hypothetical protein
MEFLQKTSATRPNYLLGFLPLKLLQMLNFKWSGICG